MKKEVPTLFVPHFYAQIAALNQSVVVGDSIWVLVLISIWEQIILYINASIMTINVAVWSLIVLFRIVYLLFAESVSFAMAAWSYFIRYDYASWKDKLDSGSYFRV